MTEIKYPKLISTFYTVLTMGGGATTGYGIWSQINSKATDLSKAVNESSLSMILSLGAPALIALGCLIVITSVFGFLGQVKKKRWMLLVFCIVVMIIFIIQVTVSVFLLLPIEVKEEALSSFEAKFIDKFQESYKEDKTRQLWDKAMTELKCCGYRSYEDLPIENNYPAQCCNKDSKTDPTSCEEATAKNEKVRGCVKALLEDILLVSGPLSFLIGIVEIFAFCVSLKVYQWLRSGSAPI